MNKLTKTKQTLAKKLIMILKSYPSFKQQHTKKKLNTSDGRITKYFCAKKKSLKVIKLKRKRKTPFCLFSFVY